MKKVLNVKNIIKIVIVTLGVAFVALVALRNFWAPEESWIYHVYDEDVAGDTGVRLFKTAVIILAGYAIAQIGNFLAWLGRDVISNQAAKTGILLGGSILKYAAFIAIILVSLSAWGIDTTAIVTGAGVLTLVIGLGCQSLVSDIVAGIFMIFEGDIRVGDVVVVNGWRGTVLQIGLRRTKIEDTVGNINIVNNSAISNIINNTRELSVAVATVGIEYNESIERVEGVIKDNLAAMKKNIPAIVEGPFYKGVEDLGNSAVIIKLVAKCKEDDIYQVRRDLNREIKIVFDNNNINIPFDQIVLNYRDENEKTQDITAAEKRAADQFVKKQKEISKGIDDSH